MKHLVFLSCIHGNIVFYYLSSKAVISNFIYVALWLKYKKCFIYHTQLHVERIKSTVFSGKDGWTYFRQGDSS
jgi:hypothetical protein